MIFLQQFCWPNVNLVPEVDLYGRVNEHAHISLRGEGVSFKPDGWLLLDTFFNSFSLGPWKKNCDIHDLLLVLNGSGKFVIQVGLHRLGHSHKFLYEKEIDLTSSEECSIPMTMWDTLEEGILYCKLIALSEGKITGGGFATKTLPKQNVKLGIVITHFNRKRYVLPAIERITNELLVDQDYKDKISLVVVDNSKNIVPEEAGHATVIPNLNLGGSGGFTRGLLHLKDNDYTHCLFMDDDASCEIESIRRAYQLLAYAKNEKMAVAGSLLREIEPFRLFEKGGVFNKGGYPLKSGLDMRTSHDLLAAERTDIVPNYGAWWFFGFNINQIHSWAFPFFVRGDDILFSLMNNFNVMTINGIGCWGEDFSLKDGVLPRYLDSRQILLQLIRVESSSAFCISFMNKLFFSALFSYNYASARSVSTAMEDVMKGPNFWTENMDMSKIRPIINAFEPSEKMQPVDIASLKPEVVHVDEGKWGRLLRIITLNGFLVPSFLLKDRLVLQHKGFRGWFRGLYRSKQVLYYYEPSNLGYIAEYNRKAFFTELFRFSKLSVRFLFNYKKLKKEYQEALPYLTSEAFWREVYKDIK